MKQEIQGLTPQAVVRELDRYIVGQDEAKRAVAIALRNRERRRHLQPPMKKEVVPKNILMIGPTGVGKTEIARRVVSLIDAPFIKVEATKFTEVGYVGRDVESMVTDLVEAAVMKVYDSELAEVTTKAEKLANEKLVDYLCKQLPVKIAQPQGQLSLPIEERAVVRRGPVRRSSRQYVARLLHSKQLEEQIVEIETGGDSENPAELALRAPEDSWEWENLKEYEGQRRWRRVPVREARRILAKEEANKLIDFDRVVDEALSRAQEDGVIFIDELDKLCGPKVEVGRDVSGEGVQRDLLPIVEGTTVMTRFGPVKTDYILFIAAGAFYDSKPSDLIPELQGRLPLRVELKALSPQDLERILDQPENSLTKQYKALLATEGVELVFAPDGIADMAFWACRMNEKMENIGARRLYTVMEQVLEDLSFTATERRGEKVVVDQSYVREHLGDILRDEDLSRYIL